MQCVCSVAICQFSDPALLILLLVLSSHRASTLVPFCMHLSVMVFSTALKWIWPTGDKPLGQNGVKHVWCVHVYCACLHSGPCMHWLHLWLSDYAMQEFGRCLHCLMKIALQVPTAIMMKWKWNHTVNASLRWSLSMHEVCGGGVTSSLVAMEENPAYQSVDVASVKSWGLESLLQLLETYLCLNVCL